MGDPSVVDLGSLDSKAAPAKNVSPKDEARTIILSFLLTMFFVTIVGALAAAVWGSARAWEDVKSLLDLALPAETALLGVAVAFYMTGD